MEVSYLKLFPDPSRHLNGVLGPSPFRTLKSAKQGTNISCSIIDFIIIIKETCTYIYPFLIIEWSGGSSPQGTLGSGLRCGTGSLGQYKTPGMRQSVWDGLWRPGGAFFQIGLGCVMSHHHIEGLCTFLLKFWRED